MRGVNQAFSAFYLFLIVLAFFIHGIDAWIGLAFYTLVYAVFWWFCIRYRQPPETVILLILVPVPHLLGVLGLYEWSIGNLSWDILVHITSSFLGVLFLDSFLTSNTRTRKWRTPARVAIAIALVTTIGIGVEIVEWGAPALSASIREGSGPAILARGAGDFCTYGEPCNIYTDTIKDAIDNLVGILLGLVATGYKHAFRERRHRRKVQR